MGNRVSTFLEKSYQLCLPSFHLAAALLYSSVFPFGVGGLGGGGECGGGERVVEGRGLDLYQFLSSLILANNRHTDGYELCTVACRLVFILV